MNSREGRGMVTVVGVCAAIGVITVVATIAWGRGVFVPERAPSFSGSAAGTRRGIRKAAHRPNNGISRSGCLKRKNAVHAEPAGVRVVSTS